MPENIEFLPKLVSSDYSRYHGRIGALVERAGTLCGRAGMTLEEQMCHEPGL